MSFAKLCVMLCGKVGTSIYDLKRIKVCINYYTIRAPSVGYEIRHKNGVIEITTKL